MITQVLHCPNCHGTDIVKHGKSPGGKQWYKCRETACDGRTFILDYAYPGQFRGCETADCGYGTKWQWNSGYSSGFTRKAQYSHSGIFKKEYILQQINLKGLKQLNPELIEVNIRLAEPLQESETLESERSGNVELCRQKR